MRQLTEVKIIERPCSVHLQGVLENGEIVGPTPAITAVETPEGRTYEFALATGGERLRAWLPFGDHNATLIDVLAIRTADFRWYYLPQDVN